MGKTKIFFGLFVVLIALGFLVFWNQKATIDWAVLDSQTTYYYGKDCSHCQRVDQFLETNRIGDKVPFIKKESSFDLQNGKEFLAVAEKCGFSKGEAGFPLVYAGGKCYLGEPDVINFFKSAAGISQ